MSRTSRLTLCALIGVTLAAIPGCSAGGAGGHQSADGRPADAPQYRPAGTRMMASDYVGGMVFGQPERRQGDTSFANAPTE